MCRKHKSSIFPCAPAFLQVKTVIFRGKKSKETTSCSLRQSQRKLVEMFQPGNKSSQAIKCFTQTPSLTSLWAPCTIPHTARLATYKTEASDHKHKKELCFAAMHFEHSNRPAPQGETGFVPVPCRKRFQPANYPRFNHSRSGHYTVGDPRGPFAEADLPGELFIYQWQTLAQDASP